MNRVTERLPIQQKIPTDRPGQRYPDSRQPNEFAGGTLPVRVTHDRLYVTTRSGTSPRGAASTHLPRQAACRRPERSPVPSPPPTRSHPGPPEPAACHGSSPPRPPPWANFGRCPNCHYLRSSRIRPASPRKCPARGRPPPPGRAHLGLPDRTTRLAPMPIRVSRLTGYPPAGPAWPS